jgi:very-long-chain enoyl-CoA reductase
MLAWLFTAVGVGAMMIWGLKKHRLYRRDFGDKYPKSRKAVIPFII